MAIGQAVDFQGVRIDEIDVRIAGVSLSVQATCIDDGTATSNENLAVQKPSLSIGIP